MRTLLARLAIATALAAALLVAATAARPRLLAWLTERAAASTESRPFAAEGIEATLQSLGEAALPQLVELATKSDPAVAEPARRVLAARVDAWRRDASLRRDGRRLAGRVEELAGLLDERVGRLTRSGHAWAERFVMDLLADATEAPRDRRAPLLARIDRLVDRLAETPAANDPAPRPTNPEQLVADAQRNPQPAEATAPPEPRPIAIAESLPPPPAAAREPAGVDWRPDWRQLEPTPLASEPPLADEPAPFAPPPTATPPTPAAATDRELLAELVRHAEERLNAAPAAVGPRSATRGAPPDLSPAAEAVHAELRARGYRGLSLRHARMLLSDDARRRRSLVDRLLVDPEGDTAKLLLLLAHDEDATVRAAALRALAASPRRELVEASWRIALEDRDPRVARVADEIAQRLR